MILSDTDIIYEDNHIIAVNKKSGIIVQEDTTGDKPLIELVKDYLKIKYDKPGNVFLGIVHRIDRPVSGLVVFAKTSKALIRLNEMFKNRNTKKTYLAIVGSPPPQNSGKIESWILRDTKINKSFCFPKEVKNSQFAVLDYKLIASSQSYHLLEIDLHTGRHHQIRAQLASIGCPIKGDLKYGFPRSNPDGGIDLHSYSLSFIHPVKKEPIKISAPLPNSKLWNVFKKIANCNLGLTSY